jgi:MFS family permease
VASVEQPIGRYGAFSYPQYRRYWISMVARVFGLTFRFIGIPVFVQFDLELSPAWLGIASISAAVPTIVLSVPAGVIADRYDHQKILLISQTGVAALSFLLAFGIMADAVNIWHVIGWQISVGALSALSTPAQAAILPRLIDMRVMPSAIAFQSSIWNTMRIIGGAIGGVMLAVMGTGQAFLVTALGFTLSAFVATEAPGAGGAGRGRRDV